MLLNVLERSARCTVKFQIRRSTPKGNVGVIRWKRELVNTFLEETSLAWYGG
jgi:hypothetical protein